MKAVGRTGLTAAHVAVAVVAAARVTGADPAEVFGGDSKARKARVIAAAGLCARLGVPKAAAARVFQIFKPELSPSQLERRGITVEDLLEVAEALRQHDLVADDDPRARFLSPWSESERKRQPAVANAPVADRRCLSDHPQDPAAEAASGVAPRKAEAIAAHPEPVRSRPVGPPPVATVRREANPVRVPRPPSPVVRIKPVTERIADWAGWFLEATIWTVEEVADLFDVDPEALMTALESDGVAA